MICFGIDFGTSNSCLAIYNGSALSVVDPENDRMPGARVYPSVVSFDEAGNMGAAGWKALDAPAHLVVDQVKRWIGKPYDEVCADPRIRKLGYRIVENGGKAQVMMGGKTHAPEDIVTFFLGHVVREGLAYLRKNGIDPWGKISVVVTYPAYYAQNQVEAIRGAVMKIPERVPEIGFDSVRLIPEPTASVCTALHDWKLDRSDRYVMVIDEGAGTLDTLVVDMRRMDVGQFEASGISIGGQAMLGGSDMDNRIMDWVIEQIKADPKINLEALNLRQLRSRVEAAKIDLSEGRVKTARIKIPGFFKFVELTEMHLEALVRPVIDRCEAEINGSLDEIGRQYGIDREAIGKVILVGGPTRMVPFRKMVLRTLPSGEIVSLNPMECVAEGAAVSPAVHYRIPAERTYGLLKKLPRRDEFTSIIRKDTPLPAGGMVTWYAKAFEDVVIEPAQVMDQSDAAVSCLTMGRYTFPAAPTEQLYYIVFKLDEERNVRIDMFNTREKAGMCLEDLHDDEGCFRLEFRREVSTRLIQSDYIARGGTDNLSEIFRDAAYGLLLELSRANDRVEECNRILAEFGTNSPETLALYQGKNDLEDRVLRVRGKINDTIASMRGAGDAAAHEVFVQASGDIQRSDAMRDLSLQSDELGKALGSLDLSYDRARILELVKRMSMTKSEAWTKVQKYANRIPPEVLSSLENTVGELEYLQRCLEPKSIIRVNSGDVELYRKGRIKEQELRNMIDNLIRQD